MLEIIFRRTADKCQNRRQSCQLGVNLASLGPRRGQGFGARFGPTFRIDFGTGFGPEMVISVGSPDGESVYIGSTSKLRRGHPPDRYFCGAKRIRTDDEICVPGVVQRDRRRAIVERKTKIARTPDPQ